MIIWVEKRCLKAEAAEKETKRALGDWILRSRKSLQSVKKIHRCQIFENLLSFVKRNEHFITVVSFCGGTKWWVGQVELDSGGNAAWAKCVSLRLSKIGKKVQAQRSGSVTS